MVDSIRSNPFSSPNDPLQNYVDKTKETKPVSTEPSSVGPAASAAPQQKDEV